MATPSRPTTAKPSSKADEKPARWSSRGALVGAAVVILLLKQFLPFSGVLFYPFTLLATWVHEMGHGIAALLVGANFEKLEIDWNAAGRAIIVAPESFYGTTEGAFVAAAGLLAPPLAGATMLALARGPKRVRVLLWVLSLLLFVSLAVWVRTVIGWVVVCVMVSLIAYVSLKGTDSRRMILTKFLGVLFALDTLSRLDYLFTKNVGNGPSDIARVAEGWGGNYLVWGLLFAAISLGLVVLGVWASWRKPHVRAPKPLKTAVVAKPKAQQVPERVTT